MDNVNEERGGPDKILKAIDKIGHERLSEHPIIASENIAEVFAVLDEEIDEIKAALRVLVKEIYNQ